MDSKWLRNSFVYLILLVAVVALFFTAFPLNPSGDQSNPPISISQVAADIKEGKVQRISVTEDKLQIDYENKARATSRNFEILFGVPPLDEKDHDDVHP